MHQDQDPLAIAYDVDSWQRILNAHEIPPRSEHVRGWIPVRARLVWEDDGEEWTDTWAFTWTSRLVLVQLSARRHRFRGVWLDPADVVRR